MSIFVYLGPSLPQVTASKILGAIYLPPVQQGDILRLLAQRPKAIGIIDGYFETVPAVWHKEILFAIESGVRVFGASSMGALRAAELHPYGMIGVGTVFEWFRDGVISCDDEVAIAHADADLDYRPLSDALVDIRDACEAAFRAGIINADLFHCLIETARSMPFADRSFEAVARNVAKRTDETKVRSWFEFCARQGPGLKSRDAVMLLRAIRDFPENKSQGEPPARVEPTTFFERLKLETAMAALPENRDAGRRAALLQQVSENTRNSILLRCLAREAAERFGWQLEAAEVTETASHYCAALGLSDAKERAHWMQSRSLTEDAFWRFINDSLLIEKLERLFSYEIDYELVNHLRMTGGQPAAHAETE